MHSDQPTKMCSDYWSSIIWKTIRLNVMHINKLALQTTMMPFIQVRYKNAFFNSQKHIGSFRKRFIKTKQILLKHLEMRRTAFQV
ncbi:hypothetical protein T07_12612 [Trichinella nelsoni]|uniref:Uncharacterized protein n=1 Tax=Trichinella nelsoni TaxID=6336 RepID=A0A0V0SH80_9BILA|nr:hypothetical protein T07_12612 [Trichinella nelsoni]